MKCSPGHAALLRRMYRSLSPDEWRQFCIFARRIRFDGEDFSKLTYDELAQLSDYASKAQL